MDICPTYAQENITKLCSPWSQLLLVTASMTVQETMGSSKCHTGSSRNPNAQLHGNEPSQNIFTQNKSQAKCSTTCRETLAEYCTPSAKWDVENKKKWEAQCLSYIAYKTTILLVEPIT